MNEKVWRVSDDVAWVGSPDGGRVAVLRLEDDVPFILAGTAAAVWNGLDGTTAEAELIEHLAREYSTDAAAIRGDVLGLIQTLSRRGAITPAGGNGGTS